MRRPIPQMVEGFQHNTGSDQRRTGMICRDLPWSESRQRDQEMSRKLGNGSLNYLFKSNRSFFFCQILHHFSNWRRWIEDEVSLTSYVNNIILATNSTCSLKDALPMYALSQLSQMFKWLQTRTYIFIALTKMKSKVEVVDRWSPLLIGSPKHNFNGGSWEMK